MLQGKAAKQARHKAAAATATASATSTNTGSAQNGLVSSISATEEPSRPLDARDLLAAPTAQRKRDPNTPPGILLKDRSRYVPVKNFLTKYNVPHRVSRAGIWINVNTLKDFRELTRCLTEAKIDYATTGLESERPLNIVLIGIGMELSEERIQAELAGMGFDVVFIRRMRSSDGTERFETIVSVGP